MTQQLRPKRDVVPGGIENARDLRQRMTRTEKMLWKSLRDGRLDGLKFRRQHPIGSFVLDFCCPAGRLAVELDGAAHDEQVEQDAYRTQMLAASGYRMIRFRNEEVLSDLGSVLERIKQAIAESEYALTPPSYLGIDGSPLPRTGEGLGVRVSQGEGPQNGAALPLSRARERGLGGGGRPPATGGER